MTPHTLLCPQCGSPLPRQALWRIVTCTYCGADVTHSEELVHAADFHAAYLRSRAGDAAADIACGGQHYNTIAHLGVGGSASVALANRSGAVPRRVVLKIAHAGAPAGQLAREKAILEQLQADDLPGAAYFTQRLPQAVAVGSSASADGQPRDVLVLRHPTGFWGSLADVRLAYGRAIDARHAVWMWRRVLEVLAYVHAGGWSHGRLSPEHLLVHPADHGVLIIGWSGATRRHDRAAQARDLAQLAWAMRAMLSDWFDPAGEPVLSSATPAALVWVLERASQDAAWCASLGAEGMRRAVGGAAKDAFGPARFIDFSPTPSN
ncbi:inactive serine/threonine-protein kinase VRK3 [Massilia sp. CCM 8734]|uniref:lipopolysaccharide kinase InaA family protein n=1 Tax=Massilia sp. CCM 8734 TaxID=2609283 RepID=UPI00141DB836|nr:inactive serine/threonine-protein kinase VRK3 [Massilia sp. CCM 8734]NHZ98481.1 protein kinase family protein [Massilia sp. CCM 8734]